jgi:catechol 2,3-dioxygenase-like lactoylglutathione lyase family enzyme
MLANYDVMAHTAVRDLQKAREFYEGVLGFSNGQEDEGGGITYRSGSTNLYVYESQFGGTNQATGASWQVDDIGATVNELQAKGVVFEMYDISGATREGFIHIMGPIKAAWFKDPDGNIFAIEGR